MHISGFLYELVSESSFQARGRCFVSVWPQLFPDPALDMASVGTYPPVFWVFGALCLTKGFCVHGLNTDLVRCRGQEPIPTTDWKLKVTEVKWLGQWVYLSAQAAVTNYHSLGGLNNRHSFSHSFGGQQYKIKVLAGWTSIGSSPLAVDGRLLAVSSFASMRGRPNFLFL